MLVKEAPDVKYKKKTYQNICTHGLLNMFNKSFYVSLKDTDEHVWWIVQYTTTHTEVEV